MIARLERPQESVSALVQAMRQQFGLQSTNLWAYRASGRAPKPCRKDSRHCRSRPNNALNRLGDSCAVHTLIPDVCTCCLCASIH